MSFIFHLILFSTVDIIQCRRLGSQHLIKSFVTAEAEPSAVLLPNLCWSRYEKTTLAKSLFDEGVNVAASLQTTSTEYSLHHLIIVADLACPGMDQFLMTASDGGFFRSPYRWLLLDPDGGSYHELLQDLDIPINSNVVIATGNNQEIQLTEVYKIAADYDLIYSARGVWMNSSEEIDSTAHGRILDSRTTKVMSVRRKNLRLAPLTVINVISDSNETRKHMDDRLNLDQDSVTKMSYMVVKICFEMLNASEKLNFTYTWGYKDKNGNWSEGVMGYLVKKEADLGTLSLFTKERTYVIEYIAMVGTTALRFVFREPPLALLENIFLLPFSGTVWIAVSICVLACAIFLYITSKWEASVETGPLQLDGTWADVFILIVGAVLQQGCTLEPKFAAGRVVMLLLFLSLTILYSAYSANIVVLLRAPSSSVRSVSDLLTSPLKLGASDFVYNRYFFKQLRDPIRKKIYDNKIAPKGKKENFLSMKEGVEKIRKGLFAFHMELNPGYRLIQETYQENEKCDLVEIDYFNENDPWLPAQKRGPYNNMFKVNFIKIREVGVQACIHDRLTVGKPRCSGNISTFTSVGISDMLPAIFATLYGILLSLAVLLLEVMHKRVTLIRDRRRALRENNINYYYN